jgi:5-methylcytosine-specific restriction endonuclease McrA
MINQMGKTLTLMKTCSSCGTTKSVEDFAKQRQGKYGRKAMCKTCASAYRKNYYEMNRAEALQQRKTYYEVNRERYAERERRRRQDKPEYFRQAEALRRSRKKHAVSQRWKVDHSLGYDGLCWWCGTKLEQHSTQVDHVMPISLGGPADETNEVLACVACNKRKYKKHPLVWIAELV